jgi:hypothetical protein
MQSAAAYGKNMTSDFVDSEFIVRELAGIARIFFPRD